MPLNLSPIAHLVQPLLGTLQPKHKQPRPLPLPVASGHQTIHYTLNGQDGYVHIARAVLSPEQMSAGVISMFDLDQQTIARKRLQRIIQASVSTEGTSQEIASRHSDNPLAERINWLETDPETLSHQWREELYGDDSGSHAQKFTEIVCWIAIQQRGEREAIAGDCFKCRFYSGDEVLRCAVNPGRRGDEDCLHWEVRSK